MADDKLDRAYAWLRAPPELTPFELQVVGDAVAGTTTVAAPTDEVRAEVVRRLFLGMDEDWRLTSLGLRLEGARIVGVLDLSGLSRAEGGHLPPLNLSGCRFDDKLCLDGARLDAVRLDRAAFPALSGKGLDLTRGFAADGARCPGDIDLEDCRTGAGVSLRSLRAPDGTEPGADGPTVSLTGAVLTGDLILSQARLASSSPAKPAINLDGACVRHVEILNAVVKGATNAQALKIAVQWYAEGSTFEYGGRWCICFDGAELGEVFLDKASVSGCLCAIGAVVKRQWTANLATFVNEGGTAINLNGADIGKISLIGATVRGELSARNAVVGGVFDVSGASFINPTGEALNLFAIRTGGAVSLGDWLAPVSDEIVDRPVVVQGQLDLNQAKLGGDLVLGGARLTAANSGRPAGVALDARGLEVVGSLWWGTSEGGRRPHVQGAANLSGAKIAGEVYLSGLAATHETPGMTSTPDARGTLKRFELAGVALSMVGIDIGGSLHLRTVPPDLPGANARAANTNRRNLEADRHVDALGRLLIEPLAAPHDLTWTQIVGCLDLSRASIGRDLVIDRATLAASEPDEAAALAEGGAGRTAATALSLHGASIAKTLRVSGLSRPGEPPVAGIIDLRAATCGELADGWGGDQWGEAPTLDPRRGFRLDLDGFVYGRLEDDVTVDATPMLRWPDAPLSLWARRTLWLLRQFRAERPGASRLPRQTVRDDYSPQPWNQLAATLRAAGHDDDARRVTMAHYDFRRSSGVEPPFTAAGSWVLGAFFGYGHSKARILGTLLAVFAVAFSSVGLGFLADRSAKSKGSTAPCAALGLFESSAACPFFVAPQKDDKAALTGHVGIESGGRADVRPCPEKFFYAMLYTVDAFLPLNLKEQERCDLNPSRLFWRFLKAAYGILGWILTPLAALTLAGVLKRE